VAYARDVTPEPRCFARVLRVGVRQMVVALKGVRLG